MGFWDDLYEKNRAKVKALAQFVPAYISGWIENHKSKPGDNGYWDPGSLFDLDWLEANVPGANNVARVAENSTYWADYKKNTGKSPRYPALQMNGGSVTNLNPYDWWR